MDKSGGYAENLFVAEFYDAVPPYENRKDIGFWTDACKESGGPVLELGCGTGRVLIPIAKTGTMVTGLDLSRPMLDVCRKKLTDLEVDLRERIELVHGDIREFSLHQKYNLIILPFRVFQHLLNVRDQLSCLNCIYKHLNPGGILILDLFNPSLPMLAEDKYLNEFGDEPEFEMPDGRKVVRRARTTDRDYYRQVVDSELIYYVTYPDGKKERLVQSFPLRYFFRYEVEHLFARTGFDVVNLYADYDKSEFGSKDPGEMIFKARKTK